MAYHLPLERLPPRAQPPPPPPPNPLPIQWEPMSRPINAIPGQIVPQRIDDPTWNHDEISDHHADTYVPARIIDAFVAYGFRNRDRARFAAQIAQIYINAASNWTLPVDLRNSQFSSLRFLASHKPFMESLMSLLVLWFGTGNDFDVQFQGNMTSLADLEEAGGPRWAEAELLFNLLYTSFRTLRLDPITIGTVLRHHEMKTNCMQNWLDNQVKKFKNTIYSYQGLRDDTLGVGVNSPSRHLPRNGMYLPFAIILSRITEKCHPDRMTLLNRRHITMAEEVRWLSTRRLFRTGYGYAPSLRRYQVPLPYLLPQGATAGPPRPGGGSGRWGPPLNRHGGNDVDGNDPGNGPSPPHVTPGGDRARVTPGGDRTSLTNQGSHHTHAFRHNGAPTQAPPGNNMNHFRPPAGNQDSHHTHAFRHNGAPTRAPPGNNMNHFLPPAGYHQVGYRYYPNHPSQRGRDPTYLSPLFDCTFREFSPHPHPTNPHMDNSNSTFQSRDDSSNATGPLLPQHLPYNQNGGYSSSQSSRRSNNNAGYRHHRGDPRVNPHQPRP